MSRIYVYTFYDISDLSVKGLNSRKFQYTCYKSIFLIFTNFLGVKIKSVNTTAFERAYITLIYTHVYT